MSSCKLQVSKKFTSHVEDALDQFFRQVDASWVGAARLMGARCRSYSLEAAPTFR